MYQRIRELFRSSRRNSRRQRRRLQAELLEQRSVLASIVVTSLSDGTLASLAGDGQISLREALEAANSNRSVDGSPAGQFAEDVITFAPGLVGTIKLSAGELSVSGRTKIVGPGADKLTIDADAKSRIFEVVGDSVEISDMTVTNGKAIGSQLGSRGGAIYISGFSRVRLARALVSNSQAIVGGGIFVARDGAIDAGSLDVVNSTVAGNRADARGGGIAADGSVTITNSTIANNQVLAGRTSGIPSQIRVTTRIQGDDDNQLQASDGSTVTYAGLDERQLEVPVNGVVQVSTARLAIDLAFGGITEQRFSASEVKIDVIVDDVETDEDGPVVIDDDVVGNNVYDEESNTLSYGLSVNSDAFSPVAIVAGRAIRIEPQGAFLNGRRVVGVGNQSDETEATATLTIEPLSSEGGGIYSTGALSIFNSTLTGNVATDAGGGIFVGQGRFLSFESPYLENTLVAGNRKQDGTDSDYESNVFVTAQFGSRHNLLGNGGGSSLFNGFDGNIIGVDWQSVVENDGLSPRLKNNGGILPTVALQAGSPAIDQGAPDFDPTSLAFDQRGQGFKRIVDGNVDGADLVDIGAVEFLPTLNLSAASTNVPENAVTSVVTISRNTPVAQPLTVSLVSSDPSFIGVPTQVTIPANASSATFEIQIANDTIAGGNRQASVSASAPGFVAASIPLVVIDDEVPTLTLTLEQLTIAENSGVTTATIRRNTPTTSDLTVSLASSETSAATVPLSVTIPAGQTVATFLVSAVNDSIASGTRGAVISAAVTGLTTGSATISVTDDDIAALALAITQSTISEKDGKSRLAISRNTPLTSELQVTVAVDKAGVLGVPATVAIPIGLSTVEFEVTAINNNIIFGNQTVLVTVQATGLIAAEVQLTVEEDDPNFPWHNSAMPLDVNADGFITPVDALIVIAELQRRGTSTNLSTRRPVITRPFYDTNQDGVLSPVDALLIIAQLNRRSGSGGEGESASLATDSQALDSSALAWDAEFPGKRIKRLANAIQSTCDTRAKS